MKKLLTLLFLTGVFATSFAQYNQRGNQGNRYDGQYATADNGRYSNRNDQRSYDGRNAYSERERRAQLDRINSYYNYKIMSIQNDRYMKRHQKKVAIRNIERERNRQIQMLNSSFRNKSWHNDGRH